MHPARNLEPLAGHPAIEIADDRGDREGDVFGTAVAAERGDRGDDLLKFRAVAQDAVAEVSSRRPRRDHIDPNATRAELLREVAAEYLRRALCRPLAGR